MKIVAETPQKERLLARIKQISDNIATQGNRATMMPMWTVLEDGKPGRDYGAVMFFTQAEAERHLEVNAHHYDHPQLYIRSAHDNPELIAVVHMLLLAGGNQVPLNHYKEAR